MAHDQHARFLTKYLRGLIENELHQPWVFVGFLREVYRFLAWFDARERRQTILRLRYDFLCDADDVAVAQRDAGSGDRGGDHVC